MPVLQYQRNRFFDNVGKPLVDETPSTLKDVIDLAGLGYVVEKVQNQDPEGELVDSFTTRYFDPDGTKHNLGSTLQKGYKVVQNIDAFSFLNDLMGDVVVESAGSINGGKQTFICAKTEPIKIFDDDIDPYMVIVNSFDGSTGVRAMFTPIRVFCSNCMAIATKEASKSITVRHSANAVERLYIAKDVLLHNTNYLQTVKENMEQLATVYLNRGEFANKIVPLVLTKMGLLDADGNKVEKQRNKELVDRYRDHLLACWKANDLANFENTAYAAINAIMDFESHMVPARNADKPETTFKRVIGGMLYTDLVMQYLQNTKTAIKLK